MVQWVHQKMVVLMVANLIDGFRLKMRTLVTQNVHVLLGDRQVDRFLVLRFPKVVPQVCVPCRA